MKKFFKSKKWIAFFLALLLVVSTSITSSDAFLWATEVQEESQVNENVPVNDNETGELEKQEITVPETDQPAEDVQTPPTGDSQTPPTVDPETPATGNQPTADQPVEGNPSEQPVIENPDNQPVVENPEEQPTEVETDKLTEDETDKLTEDEVEEEVSDEWGPMGAAMFAMRPLAEHSLSLTVGEERDIACDDDGRWTLHNNWDSSDQNVVEIVRKSGGTAHIRAKKAGNATITCGTKGWRTHTTWKVIVENPPYTKTDTTHAYGYVGFTGGDPNDPGCMTLIQTIKGGLGNESVDNNGNVWYDLGVVPVQNPELPGLTLPHNAGQNDQPSPNSAPDQVDQVKNIYKTDASKAELIDMADSDSDSVALTAANGAGGSYGVPVVSEGGMLTWHFDVMINVSNMNYTINYIDTKGNTIKDSSGKIWEKHGTVISGENVAPAIPGYQYVEDPANSIIIDKGKKNQVLTLTYEPMKVKYNVAFYYKKGEGDTAAYPSSPNKTEERKGLTATEASVTEEDKSKTGYVLDENAGNILSAPINGNGTTVLKVYLKPETDKSYTVHYYREDTKESVMDDKAVTGRTFGETYTENAVEVKGYTPVAPTSQTIKIDADNKELTFFYKAAPATIKFETNDGTAVTEMTGVTAQEITERTMPETTREGYQFDGWYATEDFTGNKVEQLPENYPAGTTTYYAKWLKTAAYKIRYFYQDPADGKYVENSPETKEGVVVGTQIDLSGVKAAKQPTVGRYVLNDDMSTLSGTVKEDGSLELSVYFALEYHVYGEIDGNGSINGETEFWVPWGGNLSGGTIEFNANTGYIIESVTIADVTTESVDVKGKGYTYTGRDNIQRNIKVTAKTKALSPALSLADSYASEPANKTAFVPGETIEYTIIVKNTGDQPLTHIVVTDDKTELNETITDKLLPNETREYKRTYTVKSDDVVGTGVVNIVNASAKVSGEFADDFTGIEVNATEIKLQRNVTQSVPSITVEIEADQNQDYKYNKGETVVYTITVTNNGNATVKEVVVNEELTGLEWTVGTLVPGGEAIWPITRSTGDKTAKYTVTSADILAGKIYNSVHVSGKDPMNTAVEDDDDVTVRTADIDASYSITKSLKDYDADKEYAAGETLTYKITVTNKGNVTLDNIVVTDQLNNTVEGTVKFTKLGGISVDKTDALEVAGLTLNEDNTVTIESLEAKEDLELECEYEITKADAALNTQLDSADAGIKNTAAATADKVKPTTSDNDPVDPTGNPGESEAAKTEARYTLIVQYQYSNGTAVREPHIDYLKAGETYVAPVPAIAGYNSNYAAVTGTMEAKDLVITVVYSVPAATGGGEDTPTTPPTPPTPPAPTVVPDIPVPAGAIQAVVPVELTEIGDEEVPLQGARIDIDEDGNTEVVPIDEEEIPLAGIADSPVLHCILHFLLLLAAVLMFLYYMISTQRRQRKLDDMRDQLNGR